MGYKGDGPRQKQEGTKMNRLLQCPRTEICFIYTLYVERTQDNALGIIEIESIENSDFYSCKAFNAVAKLRDAGKLAPDAAKRMQGVVDCLLTNQANRAVEKHRSDF
jgi:hypothetical protein